MAGLLHPLTNIGGLFASDQRGQRSGIFGDYRRLDSSRGEKGIMGCSLPALTKEGT